MDFEQRVLQFIEKNQLIPPRARVMVGVSGGADSMALLRCLSGLRHYLGVQLHAVHFNHRVRPQALRDQRFVAGWCRQYNVPLTVGHRPGRKTGHLSEEQARQMRFEFFLKLAKQFKAQAVALGHTRSDLAETVLMRLMRGSGLYGLRAILPVRIIAGTAFVRPLLVVNRSEVESYLKAEKVPFCRDITNSRMVYERNKVRHKLLPLLAREYNPRITDVLSDLAVTAGEDYEFLSLHVYRAFEKSVLVSSHKAKADLKRVSRLHPAILRLMLRQMAESLTKGRAKFSFDHIHALENLAAPGGHGAVYLPHSLKAVKTRRFLELHYG
jgi:tRNA(Ile)-lysidine synthase